MPEVRKRLSIAADEPGPVDRHHDDGWRQADPIPMGRSTERVTRAMIRALLPPPPAPTTADMEDVVYRHLRVMLRYMPPFAATGFVLLLHLLDWSPLWRFQSLRRLSSLPRERAAAVLKGIAESRLLPLRMMMIGPKGLILSTYFDQDAVNRHLGWEARDFTRQRIALRQRLLAGEAARPEDHIHIAGEKSRPAEPVHAEQRTEEPALVAEPS